MKVFQLLQETAISSVITFIASVLLAIEGYLSLIIICSPNETAVFKTFAPVGSYYTKIGV